MILIVKGTNSNSGKGALGVSAKCFLSRDWNKHQSQNMVTNEQSQRFRGLSRAQLLQLLLFFNHVIQLFFDYDYPKPTSSAIFPHFTFASQTSPAVPISAPASNGVYRFVQILKGTANSVQPVKYYPFTPISTVIPELSTKCTCRSLFARSALLCGERGAGPLFRWDRAAVKGLRKKWAPFLGEREEL